MSDFLIIGGGINGLLLARELAPSGADITLLERGRCGKEASWAGGGIVSPLYPWRYQSAVTALASWAQDFYPQLAEELIAQTGIDPQLRQTGLLMLHPEDELRALQWARSHGRSMELVKVDFLRQREPDLSRQHSRGLWMPEVSNVRNPRLNKALLSSLNKQVNVTVREECSVVSISPGGSHCTVTYRDRDGASQVTDAHQVVISAGAWSAGLLDGLPVSLKVEPVKGQMLLYKFDKPPIQTIALFNGRYLIPRLDGHLLLGSTLEYCGFDKQVSIDARMDLMASGQALLPLLKSQQPIAQWAGLRPAAPQGIPYIGRLAEGMEVYINAGQFRNGLVLAPASARLLADQLLKREPIIDPSPYLPKARSAPPQTC